MNMLKINNKEVMEEYVLKYNINDIFTEDMRPFMELLLFKKDEYICRDNEKLSYLFFFVDGKAKVYSTLSNGKSLLLCFYQGFKVLGDLEMINSEPAATNVQVIEDTYCIGIPTEKVKMYLLNDAKFLRYICNSLAEKLSRCSKNSSINLLYPLENRLASYILATGENFDESLTEISELLGTSYRHLLRTLNNMCLKGLIKKNDTGFEIINKKVLIKLASDIYINKI
jgi:CRP/FNR family transcriptional regulator, putaive post-exponential-phase nitrogen-starvation regulator